MAAALESIPFQLVQGGSKARQLLEAKLRLQAGTDCVFDKQDSELAPLEPAEGRISLLRDLFQCLRQLVRIDVILPVRPGVRLTSNTQHDSDSDSDEQ